MKTLITIETPKEGSMTTGYDVRDVLVEEKDAKQWIEDFNRNNSHNNSYAMLGRR